MAPEGPSLQGKTALLEPRSPTLLPSTTSLSVRTFAYEVITGYSLALGRFHLLG